MSLVRIDLRRPAATGTSAASGRVYFTPTTRLMLPDHIVLPEPFSVLLVEGAAEVELAATSGAWCWEVSEQIIRYVAVPASAVVLEYSQLVDVDPATLVPSEAAVPAWEAAVGQVQAIADGLADTVPDAVAYYLAEHPPEGSAITFGTTAGTAAEGNDPRLSDARTPTAHTHDDRYYTEAETDSLLSGKAAVAHTHTGVYDPAGTAAGLVAAITPASIGAQPSGSYAPALGSDDNYVTDAEKAALHAHSNKTALDLVSGTNTGDQTLPTWGTIAGKPAVVAAGADAAAARTAIGAGTSSVGGVGSIYARSGKWYSGLIGNSGFIGSPIKGGGSARILAHLVYTPVDISIDALGVEITTAAAGALIDIGLYAADGTGRTPGTRIASTGSLDCSTTGSKSGTFTATAVEAGMCWMVVQHNGIGVVARTRDPSNFFDVGGVGAAASTPGAYEIALTRAWAALPATLSGTWNLGDTNSGGNHYIPFGTLWRIA